MIFSPCFYISHPPLPGEVKIQNRYPCIYLKSTSTSLQNPKSQILNNHYWFLYTSKSPTSRHETQLMTTTWKKQVRLSFHFNYLLCTGCVEKLVRHPPRLNSVLPTTFYHITGASSKTHLASHQPP